MAAVGSFKNASQSSQLFFFQQLPVTILMTVLYVCILVTTLTANAISLTRYFRRRTANHVTNPYILCLITADILTAFVNVPLHLVDIWAIDWLTWLAGPKPVVVGITGARQVSVSSPSDTIACKLIAFVQTLFPEAIALTLCLIALERYFFILHPFIVNPMLRRPYAFISIALVWLIPFSLNFPMLLSGGVFEIGLSVYEGSNDFLCLAMTSSGKFVPLRPTQLMRTYRLFQSVGFIVVVPALVLPFCYGRIIDKVLRLNVALDAVRNKNGRRMTLVRRRRVVTFIAILVQLVHFACWLPFVVFQFVFYFLGSSSSSAAAQLDQDSNKAKAITCLKMLTLLASASPALNSLLYKTVLRKKKSGTGSGNSMAHQTSCDATAFTFTLLIGHAASGLQKNSSNANITPAVGGERKMSPTHRHFSNGNCNGGSRVGLYRMSSNSNVISIRSPVTERKSFLTPETPDGTINSSNKKSYLSMVDGHDNSSRKSSLTISAAGDGGSKKGHQRTVKFWNKAAQGVNNKNNKLIIDDSDYSDLVETPV